MTNDALRSLDALSDEWDDLEKALCSPLDQFIWVKACSKALLENEALVLFVARDGQRLAGVAPLYRHKLGRGVMAQLGVEIHHEPTDLIYCSPEALESLICQISKAGIPLYLRRVPEGSAILNILPNFYRGRGWVFIRLRESSPYVDLYASKTLQPKRLISDLRRARKKAELAGVVSCEIHAPCCAEEFLPLFKEVLRLEASNWKGRSGSALLNDQLRSSFYYEYGVCAAQKGLLRICFLLIDGKRVATQYAVEVYSRFWLLKIGYDEIFAYCSPGMLLMAETLDYAKGKGLKSYEFMGCSAPWTRRWTEKERASFAVWVYPFNVLGTVALANHAASWCRTRINRLISEKLGTC